MNITHNGTTIEVPENDRAELEAKYFAEKEWPQEGDEYFFQPEGEDVKSVIWEGFSDDVHRKAIGNCFRTREEAEKFDGYDILKALETIREHARKNGLNIATKAELRDAELEKWSVMYNPAGLCESSLGLYAEQWFMVRPSGYPAFLFAAHSHRSITDCRDAWLTLFGGE